MQTSDTDTDTDEEVDNREMSEGVMPPFIVISGTLFSGTSASFKSVPRMMFVVVKFRNSRICWESKEQDREEIKDGRRSERGVEEIIGLS